VDKDKTNAIAHYLGEIAAELIEEYRQRQFIGTLVVDEMFFLGCNVFDIEEMPDLERIWVRALESRGWEFGGYIQAKDNCLYAVKSLNDFKRKESKCG